MKIIIEQPSGTMEVQKPRCIGAWYILYVAAYKQRVLATCIDESVDGQPRRMRVQDNMAHAGEVLQPYQYEILEKNPLWED